MKTSIRLGPQRALKLVTRLPGDKSLSHRAMIIASLAKGKSRIRNFLESEDCLRTLKIFQALGVKITRKGRSQYHVVGKGLFSLRKPRKKLYCGNSGTTLRLLAGLLAAQNFDSVLSGDRSLRRRPMDRILEPLKMMGARIRGYHDGDKAPLQIQAQPNLKAIRYSLPVASAQVKSAILLAGLYAKGNTVITERYKTRDHTEIFLKKTGIKLMRQGKTISLVGQKDPRAFSLDIPGDISSAAFIIAMGLLVPQSQVHVKNILWNPTRTGFISVLKRMGAKLDIRVRRSKSIELAADIKVKPSFLRSTRVWAGEIPTLIDELPILMVLATQARGTTWFYGVEELRVKETDRILSMVGQLKKMGARIGIQKNHVWVKGKSILTGCSIRSYGDHRTAMSFVVAGMIAKGRTQVHDISNINTSFPGFFTLLRTAGCKFRLFPRG